MAAGVEPFLARLPACGPLNEGCRMFGLRMPELLIIGFIVVLLFGTNKLPELGAGLGQAIRGFKKGMSGEDAKPEAKPIAGPEANPGKAE